MESSCQRACGSARPSELCGRTLSFFSSCELKIDGVSACRMWGDMWVAEKKHTENGHPSSPVSSRPQRGGEPRQPLVYRRLVGRAERGAHAGAGCRAVDGEARAGHEEHAGLAASLPHQRLRVVAPAEIERRSRRSGDESEVMGRDRADRWEIAPARAKVEPEEHARGRRRPARKASEVACGARLKRRGGGNGGGRVRGRGGGRRRACMQSRCRR